jgi:hypothetical protein
MSYKPSQQLIDILLNAEFKYHVAKASVNQIYRVPEEPVRYNSFMFYSFKLKHMLVNFNDSMIEVSYNDKPIYNTRELSEDQLRSIIFYTRLTLADRQKFIHRKLDPFNMPAVIEKIEYFFNTLHSGYYYGYHELIGRYKRIELPPPLDENP